MIASRDLRRRNDLLAHGDHTRHFAPDRFRIFNFQRAGAAPAGANAARSGAAGKNQNHVLPKAGDLRFNLCFRAVPNPNHRDDRRNTDDDS